MKIYKLHIPRYNCTFATTVIVQHQDNMPALVLACLKQAITLADTHTGK